MKINNPTILDESSTDFDMDKFMEYWKDRRTLPIPIFFMRMTSEPNPANPNDPAKSAPARK